MTRIVGSAELAEQLLELGPDACARVCVERGHRLVEEQHRRVARERSRERDSLALSAGELAGPGPREVRDPEALEQVTDPVTSAETDVRLDAEVREQGVLLEDEPDPPLAPGAVDATLRVEEGLVAEHDPPPRGPDETRDRTQRGRLARARGPDEREGLSLDLEC